MTASASPAPSGLASLTSKVVLGFIGTWVIALMAANLVPVLIAAMLQDLAVDIGTAGALATGMTAGSALAMFVTNRFVAGADRPRLGRAGLVLMVAGYGVPAIWLTTPTVMGGLILGGIGSGIMIATGTAAASSTRNPDRTVATIMIINRLGATALLAIAPVFHNDLRTVLIVIASLGVFGLIFAGGLPNLPADRVPGAAPAAGGTGTSSVSTPSTAVRATITVTAVVLAVSMALWSLTEDMVYSMTSVLAGQSGLSPEVSGMLLAGKVGGGLVGALIAPLLLRWVGRSWSLVALIIISTATKFIMITSGSAVAYGVSIVVWGTAYGALLVLVTGLAAVMDVTGRTGVLVFAFYIVGVAFGPLIGGQLIGVLAPLQYALLVTVPSALFGIALFVIARSRRKFDSGNTTAVIVVPDTEAEREGVRA